jgi:hypothetical protein
MGTPHENPVLLCRYQDGTYQDGRSLGWDVMIESAGTYEFTVNQEVFSEAGRMHLTLDGQVESRRLESGLNRAQFQLPAGKARLDVWIQEEGKPRVVFKENDSLGDVEARLVS